LPNGFIRLDSRVGIWTTGLTQLKRCGGSFALLAGLRFPKKKWNKTMARTITEFVADGALSYSEELVQKGFGPSDVANFLQQKYPDMDRFTALDLQSLAQIALI
jgi:hypothetical protein